MDPSEIRAEKLIYGSVKQNPCILWLTYAYRSRSTIYYLCNQSLLYEIIDGSFGQADWPTLIVTFVKVTVLIRQDCRSSPDVSTITTFWCHISTDDQPLSAYLAAAITAVSLNSGVVGIPEPEKKQVTGTSLFYCGMSETSKLVRNLHNILVHFGLERIAPNLLIGEWRASHV